MRWDLWICRLGALAVGMTAGGLYVIRHSRWLEPYEPRADLVAVAVATGVTLWLILSLEVAKRRDRVTTRVVPGLVLIAIAAVTLTLASRSSSLPMTTADAAVVFGVGLLGGFGVLATPGSLRENPWSRSRLDRS